MFFKTDADRAAAQGSKARHDAVAAGSSAADGARNLGAAVVAALAEATAPQDDRKSRSHAKKAKAKALKAAGKDRAAAEKAGRKAAKHGRKAADHSKVALTKRSEAAGGSVAALAGAAGAKAAASAHHAAEVAREQGTHAAEVLREQGTHAAEVLREQGSHAAEVLRERSASATHAVKDKTGPLGEAAAEKAGIGAALIGALAAAAREKATETRDRAVLGVDHGIDAAVPRAQEGVAAMAPKVDHLRDLINDELLPKIQAMLGDVQTGKDRALAKDEGVVAALTGGPTAPARKKKKGGAMIMLGLLAAAGAAAAWYLSREQQAVATDPWASQPAQPDPWASRAPVEAGGVADPVLDASVDPAVEPAADPVAGGADVVGTTAGDTAVSPVDGEPHILTNEELDELAADVPPSADEADTSDNDEDRPRA